MADAGCCISGAAPPGSAALFSLIWGFLNALLKCIAGAVLSCCAGSVTDGKIMTATGTMIAVTLMDVGVIVSAAIYAGSIGGNMYMDERRKAFAQIFGFATIGAGVVFGVGLDLVFIAMIQRAKSAGIGKSDVPSI